MKKFLSKVMPISLAAVLVLGMIPSVGVKATGIDLDQGSSLIDMDQGSSDVGSNQAVPTQVSTISFEFAKPTVGDAIGNVTDYLSVPEDAPYTIKDNYWNKTLPSLATDDNGDGYPDYEFPEGESVGEKFESGKTYYFEAFVGPKRDDATGDIMCHFTDSSDDMTLAFSDSVDTYEFGWWAFDYGGGIYGAFTPKAAEEQKEEAKEETKEETKEEAKEETAPAEEKKEEAAAPAELKILDGADQEVDGTGDVTIRANGEFANFDKLLMDEKEVDPSNYDKKEGSTIVTLKAAYVASLGAGAHTVSFVYKDGSTVKTTLTLKAAANSEAAPAAANTSTPAANPAPAAAATDSVAPKTGENIMWIYVILAMSALGMGVTAVSIKKNK